MFNLEWKCELFHALHLNDTSFDPAQPCVDLSMLEVPIVICFHPSCQLIPDVNKTSHSSLGVESVVKKLHREHQRKYQKDQHHILRSTFLD